LKTYLDCIPCFFRQALKTSRIVTNDEALQEYILKQVSKLIGQLDLLKPPPYTAYKVYQLISKLTECEDPYLDIKKASNNLALKFYPKMKQLIKESPTPMETAIRLAIAGNIIDFGAGIEANKEIIEKSIKSSLQYKISKSVISKLQSSISKAENILYIGDNAGEIVFDKLLIEQILPRKITYVVRGKPIINDVTLVDAIDSGISSLVEVVENGSSAPGTILETCSPEFMQCYNDADLIIAKGQGNYETLNEERNKIFFLLKVKCAIVAEDTASEVGSSLIIRSEQ